MATNESTTHVLMILQRIQVEIKISFTRIWARRKMKKKIFDFGAFFIHTLWPYMVMIEKNSKSIFKLYCTNYSCHKTCFPMSSDFDQQPEQRNWANFLQYKWIGFDILVYFLVTQPEVHSSEKNLTASKMVRLRLLKTVCIFELIKWKHHLLHAYL